MFTACWDANSPLTIPMLLVRIPVKNPWEIFAYVPFGGWNECPETEQLMSIAKYWYEKHGAVPAIITHDELEMVVPKPVSKKQAMLLAQEQLISCAHGGWYQDGVIFEPLAEHFVENKLFDELRFLCERGIRFSVEDMLSIITTEKKEGVGLDIQAVQKIDVEKYIAGRNYSQQGEIAKYRKRALEQIARYIGYLERIYAPTDYLGLVQKLQKSVADLTVKAKDLKQFHFRFWK